MRYVIVVATACIIMTGIALGFPQTSLAGPSGKPTPGGTIGISTPLAPSAVLTDTNTGTAYTLGLIASEDPVKTGVGQVTLSVQGSPHSLSLCSTHGPPASIDGGDPSFFFGIKPFLDIECGTSFYMPVSVDGCATNIQFHGYVHSDYPNIAYMGPTTVDLRLQKDVGATDGVADITVYTPKGNINLRGSVTGPVVMDACP